MKAIRFVMGALALIAVLTSVGCKQQMIDRVTVVPSENFESVKVSLVFKSNVQTNLAGSFALKDYGSLFVVPYSAGQPFEVGFNLNTAIVNDQEYVHYEPTDSLPNGVPLGLGYPLVEIRSPEPISPSFDLYGYVDVLHTQWLGVATMFKFVNDQSFVPGLTISQAFQPNVEGKPAILVSVFGPTLNQDGTLKRNGGVMVLANVRQLIANGNFEPNRQVNFYPKKKVHFGGPGTALR